jgi:hypothetical protein
MTAEVHATGEIRQVTLWQHKLTQEHEFSRNTAF